MSYRVAYGYVHTQSTASDTWTITHNQKTDTPIVDCFITVDGHLEKALPIAVTAMSEDEIVVTWSSARTGRVSIT